jgi:hypothetical protein
MTAARFARRATNATDESTNSILAGAILTIDILAMGEAMIEFNQSGGYLQFHHCRRTPGREHRLCRSAGR